MTTLSGDAWIKLVDFTPRQIAILQRLVEAGFEIVPVERAESYLGVTQGGFIALVDPSGARLRLYGQAGYRMGEGIGMLVERGGRRVFVRHEQMVDATPELLAAYDQFRSELRAMLDSEAASVNVASERR